MKGRPRVADIHKKRAGTFRKDRENGTVPIKQIDEITMPPGLQPEVEDFWKIVVEDMKDTGIIKTVDSYLLQSFFLELNIYHLAMGQLSTVQNWINTTENGYEVQSPYFGIRNTALNNVLKIASHIGLSPTARLKFGKLIGTKKDEKKDGPGKLITFIKKPE